MGVPQRTRAWLQLKSNATQENVLLDSTGAASPSRLTCGCVLREYQVLESHWTPLRVDYKKCQRVRRMDPPAGIHRFVFYFMGTHHAFQYRVDK